MQLEDAYLSVSEALRHAASLKGATVEIDWIDSETIESHDGGEVRERLERADGILIPGGFGGRGIEGKIAAARVAREQLIPYLGICLGMHVAVAEFARHVAGMDGANSTEMDVETPFPVIDLLPEQKEVANLGGTMRLGADPIKLHDGSRAREIYGEAVVYERHRHRYEVNNLLRKRLEAAGLRASGTSPDERLVELVELDEHPFFVASQFHPEFKSRPERPAPLFRDFIAAALERAGEVEDAHDEPDDHERSLRARRARRRAVTLIDASSRVAELERRYLNGTFAELCRIESPSGRERACADRVIAELRGLGIEAHEDEAGPRAGSDSGNLLARIRAREREAADSGALSAGAVEPTQPTPCVLLCAHLDTVPLLAPVEPVLVDGYWENANEGVLGADNKAAVAVMLALARYLSRERAPVDVELLFTVCEETALAGARAFDASELKERLRLCVRPRLADRRGGARLAHAFPHRGGLQGRSRARRHSSRAGTQRDPGRRQGDLVDARRATRRADDGERRHDRRWERDERRSRALLGARRGAQPGRGASGDRRRRGGRADARGGEPARVRVRPGHRGAEDVLGLPHRAEAYGGSRRRGGARGVRLRARSDRQRRRLRCQRAARRGGRGRSTSPMARSETTSRTSA